MALNGSASAHPTTSHVPTIFGGKARDTDHCTPPGAAPALGRENFEDSTPALSQTNEYFECFEYGDRFWAEAAEVLHGNDETQIDTPPTSLSSAISYGSSSRSNSLASTSTVPTSPEPSPAAMTKTLKRTASQASIGSIPENAKKPRIGPSHQPNLYEPGKSATKYCPIDLSPTYKIQRCIDSRRLPYSVQWELARLVSKDSNLRSWEGDKGITIDELNNLRSADGTETIHSEGAKKVATVFYKETPDDKFAARNEDERRATDPWLALEREEAFAAAYPSQLNANGGRVHFIATLKTSDSKILTIADYKIELSRAQLGPSNSLFRHFGSKYFLRLKVNRSIMSRPGPLDEYLCRPIILCQSVFRQFCRKDQTVFYFKTNERWNAELQVISPCESPSSDFSLSDFIRWYNPIELNNNQTMAKWGARFALGLSSSIHGITLEEKDVKIIDDIKSSQGSDMTDGAGYISRELLQRLTILHGWESRPSAIQVRVRGSKGLLVENPDFHGGASGIQLRPSMVKINYPGLLDATNLTIHILRTSRARSSIRISADVIINLSENGVPSSVLQQLLKTSLEETIQPLLNWDDSNNRFAMLELWVNLERVGSVIAARRQREDSSTARLHGFSDVLEGDEDDDDEISEIKESLRRSPDWFPDLVSGSPSSLEETVMAFLESGFHPTNCAMLREKLHKIVKSLIQRMVANMSIGVPLSAGAWIVPDPSGELEPNEIFFKSSRKITALDGTETNIITGDVLVTRDPCRLPTDVQKWRAVDIPALHYLNDVVVLSVRGPRRAADWLAGGDYDGDMVKLIWQPELVQNFKNADPGFADPPSDLDSYFEVDNKQVRDYLAETLGFTEEQRTYELQKHLLGNMRDFNMVGVYSKFHEYSVYWNGYTSSETKLLAYIFTTVLDGRKTGKTVQSHVFKRYCSKYNQPLNWKERIGDQKRGEGDYGTPGINLPPVKRKKEFIMEKLASFALSLAERMLKAVEEKISSYPNGVDPDLIRPYLEAVQHVKDLRSRGDLESAASLEKDLEAIKSHTKGIYDQHKAELSQLNGKTPLSGGLRFTGLPISIRQDILRKYSRQFHSGPGKVFFRYLFSEHEISRIKASYAYYGDYYGFGSGDRPGSSSRFPWNVAFRELCLIKGDKDLKPTIQFFADNMVVKVPKPPKHL